MYALLFFQACQRPSPTHPSDDSAGPESATSDDRASDIHYVSTQGDDDGDGSPEHPWRTIQHAADSVVAGDTVIVGAGTYEESVTVSTSGVEGAPITFAAEGDVLVAATACHGFYVDADYITLRGFRIEGAHYTGDGNCLDWTASGVTTHRTHNAFEALEISDSMYGIMLRADIVEDTSEVMWPTDGFNTVEDVYVHDTDSAAVRVKRSNGNVVRGNRFERNHQVLSAMSDTDGAVLFYEEAAVVFYCLSDLTIEDNEILQPTFGPAILELDMVTRTTAPPSMAPDPEETECLEVMDGVTIRRNTVDKSANTKYRTVLTLGRDFALGSDDVLEDNVWFNGEPGSTLVEWGYNFWHDNDEDDGIEPQVWSLAEFQSATGQDVGSTDAAP